MCSNLSCWVRSFIQTQEISEGVLLDDQQKQHIVDPAKIAAGGVAAPLGAVLTSRFGVAGTMLGLAFSAVVVTTVSDILKAYCNVPRAP